MGTARNKENGTNVQKTLANAFRSRPFFAAPILNL